MVTTVRVNTCHPILHEVPPLEISNNERTDTCGGQQ